MTQSTTSKKQTVPAATDVPFPDELVGSRAVIQGASGAGKTYAKGYDYAETFSACG